MKKLICGLISFFLLSLTLCGCSMDNRSASYYASKNSSSYDDSSSYNDYDDSSSYDDYDTSSDYDDYDDSSDYDDYDDYDSSSSYNDYDSSSSYDYDKGYGYDSPRDGESLEDYIKREDPDLWDDMQDRWNSLS